MIESLQAPAPAAVTEVSEGILWVRMPLPFALDHVNLWLLRDGESWALVDTGIGDDLTRALWERLLAGPLGGRPLSQIVSTHYHPDHMGLAGWLCPRFGVPLTATHGEWSCGRLAALETGDDYRDHVRDYYRRAGCHEQLLRDSGVDANSYRPRTTPVPPAFRRISDGDVLFIGGRSWQVMTFGGHSPEHACLWCPEAGVLIAGDQILPRISPTVGVWPQEPEAEPLSLFLAALGRLKQLPESTLVLPSHDHPFVSLHQRCDELRSHHADRLLTTQEACRATPATAQQVLKTLFQRPLDGHQMAFAVAETLAHLNYLLGAGKIRRTAGDTGSWMYGVA